MNKYDGQCEQALRLAQDQIEALKAENKDLRDRLTAFENGTGSQVGRDAKRAYVEAQKPPVTPYDDLSDEAKEAYHDIEVFARRYFGLLLMPWQGGLGWGRLGGDGGGGARGMG